MSGAGTRSVVALAALLSGCIVQGSAGAGRAFSTAPADHNHAAWFGQVTTALQPAPMHIALEVEGRSEHRAGSLFSTGLQLGLTTVTERSHLGLTVHGDIGIPIAWESRDGFYTGATLQLPILLEDPLPITDRNRSLRIVGGAIQLAPFVRYRYYDLDVEGPERERFHDVAGGVALGVRYGTDLL